MIYGPEQYKNDVDRYIVSIKNQLQKLSGSWNIQSCCILEDFELLQKQVMEAHNLASTYYLQSYLLPYTDEAATLSLAAQHLSERRHGGLIVIERTEDVTAFMHNGIEVGAKVSYTMLETIFYDGNPLHDGAVHIRRDEILSAGNILPVAKTEQHGKKIGTRHRAAIGISEVTDAIAIVVSEETGRISFALQGKLYTVRN
ncbi:sporulation-specific diadenylate cyclase CdaS [Cytobacillus gottheilii]|uniref:Diadenylate cyclase n=1 Tax=Cytobacillus gottheilii TaxID=859144 RepID=A0ABX8F7N4_9BACI|nr:sporulation-specific diadenylate cyclase CdaS [Cytobacillus gottheilii]QVY59979.1 sporulation-specific diadenylate cyclase CdaS [Cytobacillus gottheilii]